MLIKCCSLQVPWPEGGRLTLTLFDLPAQSAKETAPGAYALDPVAFVA